MDRREERVASRWVGAHLEGVEDPLKRKLLVRSTDQAGTGLCKGPEAGAHLVGLKHSQEPLWLRQSESGREAGEKVRGQRGQEGDQGATALSR